jgi:hypothetical protein
MNYAESNGENPFHKKLIIFYTISEFGTKLMGSDRGV